MNNYLKNEFIDMAQLLEELEVLLDGEFEAKVVRNGSVLKLCFYNGQDFLINVSRV